uniref:Uncharacterized protein n=1 Tax=Podarcis muralis TaxID=64176 RepID=A0A670JZ74_PODMU
LWDRASAVLAEGSLGPGGCGFGGGLGLGGGLGGGFGYGSGYGSGALVGSGIPSASLGILSGVQPSCVNQIPPAEVVIQPPAAIVTVPGPILSASCEPVAVGGYAPCSLVVMDPDLAADLAADLAEVSMVVQVFWGLALVLWGAVAVMGMWGVEAASAIPPAKLSRSVNKEERKRDVWWTISV